MTKVEGVLAALTLSPQPKVETMRLHSTLSLTVAAASVALLSMSGASQAALACKGRCGNDTPHFQPKPGPVCNQSGPGFHCGVIIANPQPAPRPKPGPVCDQTGPGAHCGVIIADPQPR